jgi:hypothetical protein
MFHEMKVFGRVLVLGRVAAAHVPANHAHAQMDPGVAHLHAFFTNMRVRVPDFDLIQVRAFVCHRFLLI